MATVQKQPQSHSGFQTRDTLFLILVCLVLAAVLGLLVWLDHLAGSPSREPIEYWPMM